MKAIILEKTGGVENFTTQEVPTPEIQANEVLIETKALSINPVDYKVRGNEAVLSAIYGEQRPAILGWDIAGVVAKAGADVQGFKEGDRVFGMVNFPGAGNAYATHVACPADHLAKIPEGISSEGAAASTLAALTALQVLQGKVKPGDRVLIHAGSGGVGHFAIQIAKSMGAHVISTSSGKNKEFVLALGADEHIDYREQAFEEVLEDIDFVFDMFNGEILHNSVKVARQSGKVVSIPSADFAEETLKLAKEKNVELSFHMVQSSAKDMETIAAMLADGRLKAHVSQTFPFAEMGEAHTQQESGRTVGKIVVNI